MVPALDGATMNRIAKSLKLSSVQERMKQLVTTRIVSRL